MASHNGCSRELGQVSVYVSGQGLRIVTYYLDSLRSDQDEMAPPGREAVERRARRGVGGLEQDREREQRET